MFGHRLRVARRSAGLSLRSLAEKIDNRVTAQAISKYERNQSVPSLPVLRVLAEAVGVSVDYLTNDEDMVLEAVEFRRKRVTHRREETQIQAMVLHHLERYLAIEDVLRLPTAAWNKPREAPYPVLNDPSEAEYAARALRIHWGLGNRPIPSMVELLEDHGIKVVSVASERIDGLTARVHRKRGDGKPIPVVVVNKDDWGERQRFTMGHELGHIVMDVLPEVDEEKAAHRFAGAFLMPPEALRAEIGRRRHGIGWHELFELKQIFGVSVQALAYRCRDLGIFSPVLLRRLFREFSRRGWRSPPYEEPFAMEPERPKRFERLCYRAVAEDAIPKPEAAHLLGITVDELNRRITEPPATTVEQGREYAERRIEAARKDARSQLEDYWTCVVTDLAAPYQGAESWRHDWPQGYRVDIGETAVVLRGDAIGSFADAIYQFVAEHTDKIDDDTLARFLEEGGSRTAQLPPRVG